MPKGSRFIHPRRSTSSSARRSWPRPSDEPARAADRRPRGHHRAARHPAGALRQGAERRWDRDRERARRTLDRPTRERRSRVALQECPPTGVVGSAGSTGSPERSSAGPIVRRWLVGRPSSIWLWRRWCPELLGVVLAGPAGVGKTRLAREVVQRVGDDAWETESLRGSDASSAVPFGALLPLLPHHVDAGVGAETYRRIFEAVSDRARNGRLVIFLDDVHLVDPASAMLAQDLARRTQTRSILTVRSGVPVHDVIESLWTDGHVLACRSAEPVGARVVVDDRDDVERRRGELRRSRHLGPRPRQPVVHPRARAGRPGQRTAPPDRRRVAVAGPPRSLGRGSTTC